MDPEGRVTWDPRKASVNLAKHEISFIAARSALRDPAIRVWVDVRHADHDDRFIMIGVDLHDRLLYLVTQELPDGTIRLISARRATKRERHAYWTGLL